MIKILNEEPVAYQKAEFDVHGDHSEYWIYKNPTSDEVQEIMNISNDIRGLTYEDDYYVAYAYLYNHYTMARDLKSYNGLSYNSYDGAFQINKNEIYIGTDYLNHNKNENEIKAFNKLKLFIPDMLKCGIIKEDTKLFFFNFKYDMTIKDLMDGKLL